MDLVLWIVQILLALAFLGAGFMHATRRDRATGRMAWMLAVPKPLLTTIGILEILGAIGLVAPWATGIATWLTPLAAIALVLVMVLAAGFHARRPGEMPSVAFNLVLGLVAAVVAVGRIDAFRL
jgi:uncharacterized membrane protein YphA (DoxX/SURF4 family)